MQRELLQINMELLFVFYSQNEYGHMSHCNAVASPLTLRSIPIALGDSDVSAYCVASLTSLAGFAWLSLSLFSLPLGTCAWIG